MKFRFLILLLTAYCLLPTAMGQAARYIRRGNGAPLGACWVGHTAADVYLDSATGDLHACKSADGNPSAVGTWVNLAGGGGTWGTIAGTLASQTDLQNALNLKANLISPSFTTPILGVAIATSINGNFFTVGSYTLTGGAGKTFTFNNTLTLSGTDAATLNIGPGGTLGTAAYTAASAYEVPLTVSTGLTRSINTITVDQAFSSTWTGQHVHSLSNAAAWAIGPNGNTNPVLRIITNTASQADGVSINGLAAGSGVIFTSLSSGSDSGFTFTPKGTGNFSLSTGQFRGPDGSAGAPTYSFTNATNMGMTNTGGGILGFHVGGVRVMDLRAAAMFLVPASYGLKLNSNTSYIDFGVSSDVTLSRNAAGVLQIGTTGTNAAGTALATKYCYSATVCDWAGTGSPETVVTAGIGSTYRRTDGGAATSFYVKESGTGNTGWIAK